MPFTPFTPPSSEGGEGHKHYQLEMVEAPPSVPRPVITSARQMRDDPRCQPFRGHVMTGGTKSTFPRWAIWLLSLVAFVALWWVSLEFRGVIMVLGVFWFFALGAHPLTHMFRAGHDILDGDDS